MPNFASQVNARSNCGQGLELSTGGAFQKQSVACIIFSHLDIDRKKVTSHKQVDLIVAIIVTRSYGVDARELCSLRQRSNLEFTVAQIFKNRRSKRIGHKLLGRFKLIF